MDANVIAIIIKNKDFLRFFYKNVAFIWIFECKM